ncbi:MAG: MAPEG family protein [Aliihoeflea sp.]
MTDKDYKRPPEEIDMAAEEWAIRRDTSIGFVVTVAAFFGAHRWLPAIMDLPVEAADRLGFAALTWAVPCVVLLGAVLLVSTGRRFSAADIGGQAAGPPSDSLAIKSAFLQNTLEQTVLAGGFYFALAAVSSGAWLALLPASATLFVAGRVLFYVGYERGAKGRSLGMSLTMLPALAGYLVVAWLFMFGA